MDILYYTASKYDGVCPILHLPRLEINFRKIEIALTVDVDVIFSLSTCSFIKMCLTKVARPIRRGRLFRYTPPRKPTFGRLLQALEFNLNLPQLQLSYWVSYAKRTGVRVTTGPVQLTAMLRYTIEQENKTTFDSRRASVLQPHVMLPPVGARSIAGASLVRRPFTNWTVVHLSSSLQDSRIQLRHRPDLPGQVVQMLLQSAGLLKVGGGICFTRISVCTFLST
ncbi:unnamed protein product [Echinostoma caproni]|uniref:Uncharacterized protein n=1 Tax=Echinostoma caproni TaxID=27848 RepID=A0A3P8GMX2_9TREM|nr:unnamed protein product [Echinostoma caproni]